MKQKNSLRQKFNKSGDWFFEKITIIDKLLAIQIKEKKGGGEEDSYPYQIL